MQLDETDKFLWQYVNNDGWVDQESKRVPTYAEIVEDDTDEEDEADQVALRALCLLLVSCVNLPQSHAKNLP